MVRRILLEAEAVLHRGDVFDQDVAGVFADDRRAQNRVLALGGDDLDEAVRLAIGDGTIKVVDAVDRDLVLNVLLLRLGLRTVRRALPRVGEGHQESHG